MLPYDTLRVLFSRFPCSVYVPCGAAWHIVKGYNVLTLKNRLTGKVVRDCTAPIEFLARLKKEITEGNLHDASILIREEQKKPLFEEFTYHGSEYQRLQMYYNTKKILST